MKKITLIIALLFVAQFTKAQDTCASALPITAGLHVVGPINGTQVPTPCEGGDAVPTTNRVPAGEWYAYTPTQNYTVTITTDIAQNTPRVDTRFHIYTGTCAALTCFGGDDDGGSNYSSVDVFNATAGTTYYIAWDNRWLTTANNNGFTFQLSEAPIVVTPVTPITYTSQNINTINSGYNICIVDMNGDNLDDIVGVSNNNLRVHYQGAGGTLTVTDYPITGTSLMPNWSLAAGDYNRDGFNDLILGNGSGISIWRSNAGTGYTSITPGQYIFCQRTNFADLNDDGNLDLFSCHDIAPNVYYLNDGAGNLTYYQSNTTAGAMNLSSGGGNYSTLFTDFDNDGDTDVFISKCSGPPCQMFRYDGGNVYTNVSAETGINITPIQTWSSGIADFDNDGDMDIIITASSGTHKFFRNNFETTNTLSLFTNITSGSGWDTNTSTNIDNVSYDFDNDGKVDVLGGGNKIMFNQGNNTFAPISYTNISVGAIGDLNNDGFLDIQNGSTIRYAVPNNNNWIKLAFQGVQSNRNGIGARVEIYGAWGKQIRDVRSGEGFRYMSTLNVHFGIGTATVIDQVIIRWPSGIVDTYNNVTPNQLLFALEGATLGTNSFENSVFTVYPNPVKNNINITINTANPVEFTSAQIFDLNGRMVQQSGVQNQTITVDQLATGTYILMLKDSQGKDYSQKFVKE
ncbi:VCBS repeat-containing protein [Flavobacterium sp. J49]|uniref:FG-GAP-like repeat-containing protein n=1 Tax=Flavobacterium sp. J49 TaxID=2718534 RepID=UPI0015942CB5|nr:CRTAC1 family protein [Flavobacterium sp. J49]MBF6642290.1 VCBS repeat-containing protein [Flavobacterium sp. J49]NIC03536.1 T9SS type A sorting domain-containing protein [Flavobacterium sp. J49]